MSSVSSSAIEQWKNGTDEHTILGTTSPSDIDTVSYDNIVAPLNRFVAEGKFNCILSYASASTLTVATGGVVVSNSAGTIRLMLNNTSATTVSWADLDVGVEAVSTTYYVYAYASAVADTTFACKISINATTPTGITYYKRLGSFYNDANGDITNIVSDGYSVGVGSVTKDMLKTATGEVSGTTAGVLSLPGGEYGFFPQCKGTMLVDTYGRGLTIYHNGTLSSYSTVVYINGTPSGTFYVQQRYVTASGTDYWIFILIDKNTGEIISTYSAPDHPSYGNGGDPDKFPTPFPNYDKSKYEVVLVEKDTATSLNKESIASGLSIAELLNTGYKPNMLKTEKYIPLHTGKFIDSSGTMIKQMVETIPAYVKVRKLIKLTNQEISAKESAQVKKLQDIENAKIKKQADKVTAKAKIKALGLTEDEVSAISEP